MARSRRVTAAPYEVSRVAAAIERTEAAAHRVIDRVIRAGLKVKYKGVLG